MARTWLILALALGVTLATGGCKPRPPDADDDDTGDDDDDDDDSFQPPELSISIESPADGTIGDEDMAWVTGSVTGDHPVVVVNGIAADLDGETFSAEIPLHNGDPFTAILAEAVDDSGWVRDRHTYLHGEPTDASQPVDKGLAVRITDRGLEGLEAFVLTSFSPESIAQMILDSNPLYDDSWLGNDVLVTANDATIGGLTLDLDAANDGIHVYAVLSDVAIDVTADAGLFGSYDGTVMVDEVVVTGVATLSVSAGSLVVDMPELSVELVGLATDFPGIWDWIEDLILWAIPGFLEDSISAMLRDEIIAAVEWALGTLEDGFPLGPVTVGLAFDEVEHDPDGVNVILDLSFVLGPNGGDVPDQRVSTPGTLPALVGTATPNDRPYGAWVVLDDDALSAIGIALLGSGLLHQHLEGELPGDIPVTLTAGMFKGMFPSMADLLDDNAPLTIDTEPTVPLVGRPAHGPEGFLEFVVPGFLVHISADLDGNGTADPIYTLVIDGVIEGSVDMAGESLSVSGEDMVSTLLAAEIPAARSEGSDLASLLQLAIALMVGDLVDQLLTLIEGMQLVPLEGGACGPESDHASFYADMLAAEP